MRANPSSRWRLGIYIANVIGAPLMAYAKAKGWIGDLEMQLWSAEVTAAFALAGLNVRSTPKDDPGAA